MYCLSVLLLCSSDLRLPLLARLILLRVSKVWCVPFRLALTVAPYPSGIGLPFLAFEILALVTSEVWLPSARHFAHLALAASPTIALWVSEITLPLCRALVAARSSSET